MPLFAGISEGWKVFKDSMTFIFRKPVFLVPIFFCWIIVAFITLYNRYYFPNLGSFWLLILYIYLQIIILAFVISMSNIVMLELVQQMESGKEASLSEAMKEAFGFDLIRVIPVALIWGILWLIIVILKALTSKARSKSEPSVKDAAMTLTGMNTPFSFIRLGLNMIEKLIRMVVFMALPAIAWENKSGFASFKRSFQIIKKHPAQFLTAYSLTLAAAGVMALPLIPIYILNELEIALPTEVWLGVIIYAGIIWTLEIYLEQMSVGLLYLWQMKWEKQGGKGELSSVERPDLFDKVYELK
ncbi:MAG: hypothetical protein KKF44_04550 [Nanoarchaeota archaeon]|nr:hypothetical protein [Nanoarchaeota archaeon]